MKRIFVVYSYLIVVALLALGCASISNDEKINEDTISVAEQAIDQGKLALANGEIAKAKSNFNLAVNEDTKNSEAKEWVELIDDYEQFITHMEEKEVEKASETLNELKGNSRYESIEVVIQEDADNLNEMVEETKKLTREIEDLKKLYDPHDENAMPDETYLVASDEILSNEYISEEQRDVVKKFKKDATDRANQILAAEEEKMNAANSEAQQDDDPYEWAPGVKETFENEMIESGYADSIETIRYEKFQIYNNQGFLEVYAELDGVEYRIVSVNVKTGDYHG
ncbi:hypothetical protein [Pseudalkalibacillus hwajinpoensis]|uniref:hypothetical protein n=1 Tax=Guptibacillus hwajinpoensis TaxID=208199 RepID=UPI001CFC71CF|nr:hypothetical protein [Pseudalkalibacillus hwajinpoensis]